MWQGFQKYLVSLRKGKPKIRDWWLDHIAVSQRRWQLQFLKNVLGEQSRKKHVCKGHKWLDRASQLLDNRNGSKVCETRQRSWSLGGNGDHWHKIRESYCILYLGFWILIFIYTESKNNFRQVNTMTS